MTRAWPRPVAALLMLAAFAAVAAGQNGERRVKVHPEVGPKEIQQFGEWLKGAKAGDPTTDLIQDALKKLQTGKSTDLKKFAEEWRKKHPEIDDPDNQEKLRERVDQLREQYNLSDEMLQQLGRNFLKEPSGGPGGNPRPGPDFKGPLPKVDPSGKSPFNKGANPNPQPGAKLPDGGPSGPAPVPPSGRSPDGGRDKPERHEHRPSLSRAEKASQDRTRQYDAVRAFWEKNIGPLEETPAVRDILREMITGADPLDADAASGLASLLGDEASDPNGLANWAADQAGAFEGWHLPDLGLGGWSPPSLGGVDLPSPGVRSPGMPAVEFGVAGGDSWLPVVLFVLVLVGALLLWRFWPQITGAEGSRPRPLPGLGPWPVDPRAIADRDALVRAFEYLSVLVCGAGARAWNHVTIAAALERTTGTADAAEPLARLYALARYAPAGDPLPPEAIAEARRHLCRLAGVAAP